MNQVNLVGNIATDINVKQTQNGKTVAYLNLAVDDMRGNTQFIPITIWENQAINLDKYCTKGKKIGVQGYLKQDKYIDAKGEEVYKLNMIASHIEYL